MTYGELKTINAGWVTSHVIDDICNNARYEFGKSFKTQTVDDFDMKTIREKAVHFGEPVPLALKEVA